MRELSAQLTSREGSLASLLIQLLHDIHVTGWPADTTILWNRCQKYCTWDIMHCMLIGTACIERLVSISNVLKCVCVAINLWWKTVWLERPLFRNRREVSQTRRLYFVHTNVQNNCTYTYMYIQCRKDELKFSTYSTYVLYVRTYSGHSFIWCQLFTPNSAG